MRDSIDRQAAIDAVDNYIGTFDAIDVNFLDGLKTAKKLMMQLPSAQPEIIRCKECLMHGVCRFEQGLGLDGYCSQAERRTDEGET